MILSSPPGVAMGVVITALLQTVLSGIGLVVVGVPFAGVIGGLMAFGVVGIFVGPVVLAVAYTLLDEWIAEDDRGAADNAYARAGATTLESGRITKTSTEPAT